MLIVEASTLFICFLCILLCPPVSGQPDSGRFKLNIHSSPFTGILATTNYIDSHAKLLILPSISIQRIIAPKELKPISVTILYAIIVDIMQKSRFKYDIGVFRYVS
ncbi:hypothetical protein MNBD_GAMMA10-2140 [hydrothermal vent metagenome]|uniref:Uncharacterized protein n=1 Tax=hydrothermal vent metagenome TaxID=652676 RepID=A0A3B0X9X4_9ZZZZ